MIVTNKKTYTSDIRIHVQKRSGTEERRVGKGAKARHPVTLSVLLRMCSFIAGNDLLRLLLEDIRQNTNWMAITVLETAPGSNRNSPFTCYLSTSAANLTLKQIRLVNIQKYVSNLTRRATLPSANPLSETFDL